MDTGRVITFHTEMPQFGVKERRVWVYLPPGYDASGERYSVLYMQDGQNLFDPRASYCGEWGVDKALDGLFWDGKTNGAIVVGVDNGREERWNEYSPWCRMDGAGRCAGEQYARFLVNTLKPQVDARFRTLAGRDGTGVAGSSLGATIALYAALKYPGVFSKAGLLSPSFWFAQAEAFSFVKTARPDGDLRIYMDVGTDEGERGAEYLGDAKVVSSLLAKKSRVKHKFVVDEGGIHNEKAWARRFPGAFLWLFEGAE